ncbi:hypothetical protein [Cohnella herbarum]|uniref:Uncharacterized protein n=1 Tax=Cohnella herbarum TaxID=2728023 RepID=A0A7Z2VPJ5_9BACL|nr:hypothetical protein [Cohnella herbarum]QJD86759.1 hypothetical protein HH215_28705 [Cohnella herbarum]
MPARRYFLLFGVVLMLGLTLSACNYKSYFQKSNNDYASRSANDPKMMHVRSYGSLSNDPKQHDNRYFEYSSALSNKVAALPGINTALVFLTDKNAYVGILTDWSATGTEARGGPRSHEQDNSGTTEGVYNVSNGSSKWDNRQVATPYNSYFTHKDYGDLSTELRQVIGNTVRSSFPRAQEVHISANREFVNQSLEYAKVAWLKKSLTPLTADFNTLVQYTFDNGNEVPIPLYLKQKTGR